VKKTLLFTFLLSFFCTFLQAQTNVDTPNLSFESTALSIGWKLYLGDYILNPADSSYSYNWTLKTPGQVGTRIMLLGNGPTVNDPVIACGGLYTNPKTLVARIGEPIKRERNGVLNTAAAERLEYTFTVTPNTTLLSYKMAAVLKVPSGDTHGPLQLPAYNLNISVTDTSGVSYILPCSSYNSKADSLNHNLTRNIVCNGSIGPVGGGLSTDYVYQKWISGNIDFSNQIGKTVTITIINHDCLVKNGGNIKGGGHDAYGYFWAETKKIELTSFSCENSDATIVAPQGFTSYIWSRSDGKPITIPDATQPWIASIDKSLNLEGIVYSCAMDDANSACGAITISTTITPVKLHPDFTTMTIDAGKIKFTSTSTAEGDSITNYYWDFGDGVGYSSLQNPTYTYSDFKPFNVKLTVTSSKGCNKTVPQSVLPTKELIAKIFPPANLVYNGQTKDFTDSVNIASLQLNIDYFIRYTNRLGTPYYNNTSAPSTVGDYTATFELSYLSLIKYFMTSTPKKDFTITKAPLTVTINNVAKTYGESITLLREGFTQSMKPLYAGDKIYELELKCGGLSDTASVRDDYNIKADSAIGLGVKNYKITFVDGTLTVNPKLLSIAAIDNSKTYGDQINPTGKEFYIVPGTLVGKDSVTSVSLQCDGFDKLATVGTPPIIPSGAVGSRLSNYTISYKPATMVVSKKKITIKAKKLTKVYGTPYTFSGKEYYTDLTQFVGTDSITTLQFKSLATPKTAPVGDYPLDVKGVLGYRIENYSINDINASSADSLFRVNPMPVTIIANDTTKEYSDFLKFNGTEFTTNKPLVNGDYISAVSLVSDGCVSTALIGNDSIYASKAYVNGSSNYDFTYIPGVLRVVKKKMNASIFPPDDLGYKAQTKDFRTNLSVSGLALNKDYDIRYTNSDTYDSIIAPFEAGDYTATFELKNSKYVLDSAKSILTRDFTIAKVPITITTDDQVKTYGDVFNSNLLNYAYKMNMKPLYGSDRIDELVIKCDGLNDTASVDILHSIQADSAIGGGLKNYDIHFVYGTLRVNPKLLSIAAKDNSKIYGDQITPTGKEFYIAPGTLVGKDSVTTVSLQCTGFDKLATVGTPQIVASAAVGSRLSNYTISYKPATMVVSKKKITVTAKRLTKVYGTPYTFNGKEYDTDLTKFVGTDSISQLQLTSEATPMKASVRDYPLTIDKVLGYRIDNYDINSVNNMFRVDPMPVTIIANDTTKEYGDFLKFNGTEFTTNKPLVIGDYISAVSLASDGCVSTALIGNDSIYASKAYGNGSLNYDFTYIPGVLRVVKKKMTAHIIPPKDLGYKAQTKDFTDSLSVSGLFLNKDYDIRYTNSDTYNSIIAPFEAGDYTATFELNNSQYVLDSAHSILTRNFTIAKVPITITTDDQVKTYGDVFNSNLLKYAYKMDMKPLYGSDRVDELVIKCDGLSDTASVGILHPIQADSAIGGGLENYRITFNSGNLTVKPKALVVKVVDVTKTYGETIIPTGKEFYVDANSLVANDTVLIVNLQSDGYAASTAVGTYHIKVLNVSGRRLNNYLIASIPDATLHVTPKKITVAATSLSKLYGNEYVFTGKEFSTDSSQFVGKDSISSIEFTSDGADKTAYVKKDYELEISKIHGNGLQNYEIQQVNSTLTVKPIAITIIPNNITKPYGGLFTFNGTEFTTDKPLVNGDAVSFVVLNSSGCAESTPVGDYDIFALLAYGVGTMNYDFAYLKGKFSVVHKALTAKIYPPSSLVYNAQAKEFTATVSIAGLVQNTDYFIRYTNKAGTYNSVVAPSTVGDYTASFELSGLSALKYTIDTIPVRDFTITKAQLTITANNETKTYGEKLTLQTDAFKADLKPFGSDVILGVNFDCKGLADTASVKKYPISPIKVIGSGIENYDIHFVADTLIVNPKQLTVKAVDGTKTYGDLYFPNSKSFYVDTRDLIANDMLTDVTLSSDGYKSDVKVGSYSIKASNAVGVRLKNYLITYTDGNFQVLKKKITVSAKSISKVYGCEYVFKGDEFESVATQLVGTDKITGVLLNSPGAAATVCVAQYTLSIKNVSGDGIENYDITPLNGVLSVTPKPIVVIGKDLTKEYGDVLSFSGNEFTTDIPMLNNDTISFAFLRSNGSIESAPIGLYDIIPAQASGAGSLNYSISYRPGKLTVAQKQLLVKAQNCIKEYGENDPEKKFSVIDKRGVEYQSSMFTGNIAREPGEKVGIYAITKGTLSISASYAYTFSEGKLTIEKALPTIEPVFTNNAGQFIIADVFGSRNGDNPQGNLNIKIKPANIDNTIAVTNGVSKCLVTGLPNQMVEAEFNYLGDDNYLPATKTLNIYAVIYHCNGGSLTPTVSNFDGSESVKLETPARENNYKFEGWFENADFSGIELRRIPVGTDHDVNLYAKWSVTFDDLSIVVLFNQVLAVANPLNRDFLYTSTYKWYKDGTLLDSNKQYCGFDNYVPSGNYQVEIYYLTNAPIVLQLNHLGTIQKSKLYPNPLPQKSQLSLVSELVRQDGVSVEVYNLLGVRQTSITVDHDSDKFMLNGFINSGVYIIRLLKDGDIMESHKVIVED